MSFDTIYFVRHGETDMNLEKRCQGRIDIPLNQTGRQQAAEIALKFENKKIDSIYSSPLSRAVESIRPLAETRGIVPVTLDWLTEIDHGELEGFRAGEGTTRQGEIMAAWDSTPEKVKFPGGESLAEVAARVATGLHSLLQTAHGGTAVFITHQVLSCLVKCLLDGHPISDVWQWKLVNADYFEFAMNGNRLDNLARYTAAANPHNVAAIQ